MENRRKNKQDYLLYPAFFFRRVDKEQLKKFINKSNPADPGGDREKRKNNTSGDHKTSGVLKQYNFFFYLRLKSS